MASLKEHLESVRDQAIEALDTLDKSAAEKDLPTKHKLLAVVAELLVDIERDTLSSSHAVEKTLLSVGHYG